MYTSVTQSKLHFAPTPPSLIHTPYTPTPLRPSVHSVMSSSLHLPDAIRLLLLLYPVDFDVWYDISFVYILLLWACLLLHTRQILFVIYLVIVIVFVMCIFAFMQMYLLRC